MTLPLPGRFVPKSGTLHKWPASEQCNLDDTGADTKVETAEDLKALPPDVRLCGHCYSGAEKQVLEERWDDMVDVGLKEQEGILPGEGDSAST